MAGPSVSSAKHEASSICLVLLVEQTLCPLTDNSAVASSKNKSFVSGYNLDISKLGLETKFAKFTFLQKLDFPKGKELRYVDFLDDDKRCLIKIDVNFTEKDAEYFSSLCRGVWQEQKYKKTGIKILQKDFARQIAKHFIVASNISKPNSVTLHDSIYLNDENIFKNSGFNNFHHPLNEAIAACETGFDLRLTRELSFDKIWKWYSSLKGTLSGIPEAPVEIAVCNFISLFSAAVDASGARDLVWSFAGLEALFAESESGITAQLRSKLIAVFGNQVDIKDFDKMIKQMYQHRSNIVHGKMKRKSQIQEDTSMVYDHEDDGISNVSTYLLLAVIQYCCQNGLDDIKFKTVTV